MTPLRFYFAGELFSLKHLLGNAVLASAIHQQSEGRYVPILPQDLELRDFHPKTIRDNDLNGVLEADLALFHFDGTELDSGTVVEFLVAKFADIPSILLRTDFRAAGDQEGDPWNLMASFFPRTEVMVLPAMSMMKKQELYQPLKQGILPPSDPFNLQALTKAHEELAIKVIESFDRLVKVPSVMHAGEAAVIFPYLQRCLDLPITEEQKERLETCLKRKTALNIIPE